MAKTMQIELPDEVFDVLATIAAEEKVQPEQIGADLVTSAVLAFTGIDMGGSLQGLFAESAPDKRKKKAARALNTQAANTIYQLKITLKGSKPPIWRRVQVPGSITLAGLHDVIQVAMGWEDDHLHQFVVKGVLYGPEDLGTGMFAMETVDEETVTISEIAPDAGAHFTYEYDFGDGWEHQILVEKLLPREKDVSYPVCIAGKRACPPEDIGGIWGYQSFVEALRDPADPQHKEILEWFEGDFDPEEFDLEATNEELKALR